MVKKELPESHRDELLEVLKKRFEGHMDRHEGLDWAEIQTRLKETPEKAWSLDEMERTGGEPDVIGIDKETGEYLFVDCCAESPKGRRNVCYDDEALKSRKQHKPDNSVVTMAAYMDVEVLSEAEYRHLQTLGQFDLKTSSWVKTPPEIRKLGGAVFCDRRYDTVFYYHNGAESYYSSRGFRAVLRV